MWVQPNTTIKLYNNVPLDNSYEDTLYFDSLNAQANYFHGIISSKYIFDAQSYQRVRTGVMRVQVLADNVYDCNYMAFRNTNHGNKWFYAFITGCEYIGEKVTEITYELDLMQTYFFDVQIGECFVERETQRLDVIGQNIKPEPVSLGEYLFDNYTQITTTDGDFTPTHVIIGVTDVEGEIVEGLVYDHIYSGNTLYCFPLKNTTTDVEAINIFLEDYVQQPDAVNFMYMIPEFVAESLSTNEYHRVLSGDGGGSTTINVDKPSVEWEFDSFTHWKPKNHKLYTYPYSFLHIDNGCGQGLELRYEFFDRELTYGRLRIDSTLTQPVQVTLRPSSYKGTYKGDELKPEQQLMTETISLNSYPQCSWNTDAYKAWLAQNSVPIAIDAMGGMANMVAETYLPYHRPTKWGPSIQAQRTTREVGVSQQVISGVTDVLKSAYTASIQADICKGRVNNGNVNCTQGTQGFYKAWCHITPQMAKSIDDFFTRYGYSCHEVKKPNRCVREHWTYCKTIGCIVKGKAPAEDLKTIREIYDSGITFWRFPSEVGNYELDNSGAIYDRE